MKRAAWVAFALLAACVDFDAVRAQTCAQRPWVCDAGPRYCQPCDNDSQCGGTGNFCLDSDAGAFCGADCSMTTCGAGRRCVDVMDHGQVIGQNCAPLVNATCDAG